MQAVKDKGRGFVIRKIRFLALWVLLFLYPRYGSAEYAEQLLKEGRYVLVTVTSEGIYVKTLQRKVPAIILDSVRGIVWRCQNLQDEKPLWIKTDLAKNGDAPLTRKKYVVQIPGAAGNELKIPAIVLDMDEGKTWTCHDITSETAPWVEKDLVKELKEEGYRYR